MHALVIAVTQNIDTDESNPMARLLMHLMGAFSEFEREMIRDRIVAGVRAARARGKTLGRPQRIFRRDEVITMRASGSSWRAISKQTGVPVCTLRDAAKVMEPYRHAMGTSSFDAITEVNNF